MMSWGLELPIEEARTRIKSLTRLYYSTCNPHDDNIAKNITVHGLCGRIIQGKKLTSNELEMLANALHYRMFTIVS